MSKPKAYKLHIPEVLWHGGGNEHGKPDPVYSVDIHPVERILLTSGIDASVPPKGSVRVRALLQCAGGRSVAVCDVCGVRCVVCCVLR